MPQIIKKDEIGDLMFMVMTPPQSFVDADYLLINHGSVYTFIAVGWMKQRDATEEDYKNLPELEPSVWLASDKKDLAKKFYKENSDKNPFKDDKELDNYLNTNYPNIK